MKPLRKFLYILSWIPLVAVHLVAILLGLIIVPVAIEVAGEQSKNWPKVFWLWGNDEEGVPDWWLQRGSSFWWYAIRNPVNNFRFLFADRVPEIESNWFDEHPMESANLQKVGQSMAYRWAYSGPFAGYRQVWLNSTDTYSEFWIGWKIGSTVPGMGFTMQYRRNRDIGT